MPRSLRFDVSDFLSAWHATHAQRGTIHDVANALGVDYDCVRNRAYRLRSRGIVLPRLKRLMGKPEVCLHHPVETVIQPAIPPVVVQSGGFRFTITVSAEPNA